jgi:hypothetical protein
LNPPWTSVSTMSSETSTESRSKADVPQSLQPWQFFVLTALGCATALTFLVRSQGPTAVVLASILMATIAVVALGVLRTVRPLVTPNDDKTVIIGQRTRMALEQEKALVLRAIKELEFDRAMGKLSDDDFREMSGRLRARAVRLIRQLENGGGYRAQIERDLAKRLGDVDKVAVGTCAKCSTVNDRDAKFCKACGERL